MLECEQCGKELPEGTKAHIIEYRRIDVRGTRVIIKCVKTLVCKECANRTDES